MRIAILLPFPDAAAQAGIWAYSEREIHFGSQPELAARCTMAYAAVELKTYLEQTLLNSQVRIAEQAAEGDFVIRLRAKRYEGRGEHYALIPEDTGIAIEGEGRVGVLYGAYELLKLQGWRWYEPGAMGEYAPEPRQELLLPQEPKTYTTPSWVGRGWSLDGHLNESEELAVWMARNRINIYFARPHTCHLMHKLGVILREGGHIFEEMLNPDRLLPDGRTLWEAHEDWFGLPSSGKRSKELAHKTQFCVSQPDCLEYLAEDLLKHIMDEWHEADAINVWGFDTWGDVCTCEKCKALGNGTDQNLHMASYFRDYLNKARKDGRLDRDVQMVLSIYEGSSNLMPPENPVPQNLLDAGDHGIYATIVRCYAHDFDDPNCSYNREYYEVLQAWNQLDKKLPMTVHEYYNVSKFEDLPLLFTNSMKRDVPCFFQNGADGLTYMHIPMVNWGVRTLTQVVFAELAWDPGADVDAIVEEYFDRRYGAYAPQMKEVYAKIEEASAYITSWRAWKDRSLLSKLQEWDGRTPECSLQVDDHFGTPERFEEMGVRTEQLMLEALEGLEQVIRTEKNNVENINSEVGHPSLNPGELLRTQRGSRQIFVLTEDKRNLVYGVDTVQLMLRLGQYYNALYDGREARAAELWGLIEESEERMERYYMPATYSADYLALISRDALARTQLKETIARCRKARILGQ